jgi:hypothetical protein
MSILSGEIAEKLKLRHEQFKFFDIENAKRQEEVKIKSLKRTEPKRTLTMAEKAVVVEEQKTWDSIWGEVIKPFNQFAEFVQEKTEPKVYNSSGELTSSGENSDKEKKKPKLSYVEKKILQAATPITEEYLDAHKEELIEMGVDVVTEKIKNFFSITGNNIIEFVKENPAAATAIVCSALTVATTAGVACFHDTEDAIMAASIGGALSFALSISVKALVEHKVDITPWLTTLTTVTGAATFSLALVAVIRSIITLIKSYTTDVNEGRREVKEPSAAGMAADIFLKMGVFAGLFTMLCGNAKEFGHVVSSFKNIKQAFDIVSEVFTEEPEILKNGVEATPDKEALTVRMKETREHVRNLRRYAQYLKSIDEREELMKKDPNLLFIDEDVQIHYKVDVNKSVSDENRLIIMNYGRDYFAIDSLHHESYDALVSNNIIYATRVVSVKGVDKAGKRPPTVEHLITFCQADVVEVKPDIMSRFTETAHIAGTYIENHKDEFIVGAAVLGSVVVAASAGLAVYLNREDIKKFCEEHSKTFDISESLPVLPPPVEVIKEAGKNDEIEATEPVRDAQAVLDDMDELNLKSLYRIERFLAAKTFPLIIASEGQTRKIGWNSADRGRRNALLRDANHDKKEWKKFRKEVKSMTQDWVRADLDAKLEERENLREHIRDYTTYCTQPSEVDKDRVNEMRQQVKRLSKQIFEYYDMYHKVENTAKVTSQASVVAKKKNRKSYRQRKAERKRQALEAEKVKKVGKEAEVKPKKPVKVETKKPVKESDVKKVHPAKGPKPNKSVKEAQKPKEDKKNEAPIKTSSFQKKFCYFCCKPGHVAHPTQCDQLCQPQNIWDNLGSQQKKNLIEKNRAIIATNKAKNGCVQQSLSLHKQIPGNVALHANLIKIYYQKAGNPGSDSEFFGSMIKVIFDGTSYVVITEHQLLNGVYYNHPQTGKATPLPPKADWETFGKGTIAFCRIPSGKINLPSGGLRMSVVTPQIGTNFPCCYIGYDPATCEPTICTTAYSWDGDSKSDIIHSATTANFSCGAFLYDAELCGIVGLHHGTVGPNSKRGNNNLCSPLKAMGPRQ